MAAPLVSVVIPVYNGAKYLREACESVLSQTYEPLELIVVDDGSTDDSPQVIRSYGSRVASIRQDNGGVSRARNTGIQAAKGEYVAFLDQDDWFLPDKIARQVERFRADGSLGLVHTGILQYSSESQSYVKGIYQNISTDPLEGWCYDRLLFANGIINSSVMVRKTALTLSGGFDETMPGNTIQDYDLWLRIARRFPLCYVPESLTVIRLHREQGTWDRRAMLKEEVRLMERVLTIEELGQSAALRARMAQLLESLGMANLDAGDNSMARHYFVKAMHSQRTRRRIMLCLASFVPHSCLDRLRNVRMRFRRRKVSLDT